jgi:heptosyltransferase III
MKSRPAPIPTKETTLSVRGSHLLRLIDRYVGIPLVASLGLVRKRRALPSRPARIGLLNTAAIGDTVLMSAGIADLRDRYPQTKLILFAGPSNYAVSHLIPKLDLIVLLKLFNPIKTVCQIRDYDLDVLLDFGPWPRLNSIISAFSGARFIAGFKTEGQYRHFAYDVAVEHSSSQHELENFRGLISAADAKPRHMPTLRYVRSYLANRDARARGYIILHMWPGGTRSSHKEWPQDRWQALAERLVEQGYAIFLTGSREQFGLNEEFIVRLKPVARPSVTNIAGCNFSELAHKLHCADLVVSVNTGVMHMADALSPSLVALHGPTNPRRWGPLSATSIALESPLPCCGYLDLGFEFPHRVPDCMSAISFETVLTACLAALRQTKPSSRGNATKTDLISQ